MFTKKPSLSRLEQVQLAWFQNQININNYRTEKNENYKYTGSWKEGKMHGFGQEEIYVNENSKYD